MVVKHIAHEEANGISIFRAVLRCAVSAIVAFPVLLWLSRASAAAAQDNPNLGSQSAAFQPIRFPSALAGGRMQLDEALVKRINSMDTRKAQIDALLATLPSLEAKNKTLTFTQYSAMFMLGLADADEAADALSSRLEFQYRDMGSPAIHALSEIGEKATGSLVGVLQESHSKHHINSAIITLKHIKGRDFPVFVETLKRRKDIRLTPEALTALSLHLLWRVNF